MTTRPTDPLTVIEYLLRRHIGLEPNTLGRDRIAQALGARLASHGQDVIAYLRLLDESEDELRALVDEVVVPETWFFRDRQAFRHLRRQVRGRGPTQARSASEGTQARSASEGTMRPFRVLSVPCCTGEEPYSIAIVLLDAGLGADDFEVVAADVSPAALATAAGGSYTELSFRERDPEFVGLRERFCHRDGERSVVAEAVRGAVRFLRANMAAPQFLDVELPFDAIFCRNLFIYLDERARRTALGHLRRLLLASGALYFSAVEAGFVDSGFRRLDEEYTSVFTPSAAKEVRPPATVPSGRAPAPAAPGVSRRARERIGGAPPARAGGIAEALVKARQAADADRLEEAASLCAALADRGGPRADVLYLLGVVRQAQGDFAEAERCFQRVLYLDPRHAEALVHVALLARRRGDQRLAENFLRRLDKSV